MTLELVRVGALLSSRFGKGGRKGLNTHAMEYARIC